MSTLGKATLVITISTILILGSCPAGADKWGRRWSDGEWNDTYVSQTQNSGTVILADSADVFKGKLDMLSYAPGAAGYGTLDGTVKILFTYDGTSGDNWVKITYSTVGAGSVWAPLTGACVARYKVRAKVWHTPGGSNTKIREITDYDWEKFGGLIPYLWRNSKLRTFRFKCPFVQGEDYMVDVLVKTEVISIGVAEATVDFYTEQNATDLYSVYIYHSHDSTVTSGGSETGDTIRAEYSIKQKSHSSADKVRFISYNQDQVINGWRAVISDHTSSTSVKTEPREVEIEAWGADIPRNEWVDVSVKHWLDQRNVMGIKGVKWSNTGSRMPLAGPDDAMPDHYWCIAYPVEIPDSVGFYNHRFIMRNDDDTDTLKIDGLSFHDTSAVFQHLSEIEFNEQTYEFILPPGVSWFIDVITEDDMAGDYIYFKYSVSDSANSEVICNAWGGHPIEAAPDDVSTEIPAARHLSQNYPNPFNPQTAIQYSLAEPCWVMLDVYDVSGKLITSLVDDHREAGSHIAHWKGKNAEGRPVSSGIYFYRIRAGDYEQVRKMVLLR